MIPAIVLSLGMLLFPESPRYLIDHGRYVTYYRHIFFPKKMCREDEALQVLADLHGGGDKTNELVVFEYEEIRQQVCISALIV